MPNKTSFKDEWLKKKDSNGQIIEQWCVKQSKYEVFCRLCKKVVRCDNRGLSQLLTHSETKLHSSFAKDVLAGTQTILVNQTKTSNEADKAEATISCWTAREEVIKAELLWSLKSVRSDFSYNSADDTPKLFQEMFPDSNIASRFSMSHTKLSYMITEATGPYFHEALLYDIRRSSSPYSISFDELTNREVKKQLDLKIRYWSSIKNEVVVHHLDTHLMGQAKANTISEKIIQTINDAQIPLADFIALGSDGPNVNKAVFQMVTEVKKSQDLPPLLNIGFCNLHSVHNAFSKALHEFGDDIVDLIVDLHYFFKLSPVRVEELKQLQDELGFKNQKFLKHVQSRWLTLGPALERLLSQWSVAEEYFLNTLPERDKKITENGRYNRIIKFFKTPVTTLSKIHFLISVSNLLQQFLKLFQKEEPLIHLLFDQMVIVIKNLLGRFIRTQNLKEMSLEDLKNLKFPNFEIELSDKDIDIGENTRKLIGKLKAEQQSRLIVGMRKFLRCVTLKLLDKVPTNGVIREARCLKAQNRCESWTLASVKNLAASVKLKEPLNVDIVSDEWKVLQCENIPQDWYSYEIDGNIMHKRVDHYYSQIFALNNDLGQEKYPELTKLVKAVLVIPHGNADVERGFSQTSNFLTSTRTSLSAASISALQSTKDGLKKFDNKCHLVPITKDFINKGARAYKSYLEKIEEEKRVEAEIKKQKEEEKQKKLKEKEDLARKKAEFEKKSRKTKEVILKEKTLGKKEDEAASEMDTYKTLVDEANERIKNALKNQDLKGVKIGQTMLEAACKKVEESKSSLAKIRIEQKEIEKTKRTMLDYFISSQNKKLKKN